MFTKIHSKGFIVNFVMKTFVNMQQRKSTFVACNQIHESLESMLITDKADIFLQWNPNMFVN